jgi:hypothetical protein
MDRLVRGRPASKQLAPVPEQVQNLLRVARELLPEPVDLDQQLRPVRAERLGRAAQNVDLRTLDVDLDDVRRRPVIWHPTVQRDGRDLEGALADPGPSPSAVRAPEPDRAFHPRDGGRDHFDRQRVERGISAELLDVLGERLERNNRPGLTNDAGGDQREKPDIRTDVIEDGGPLECVDEPLLLVRVREPDRIAGVGAGRVESKPFPGAAGEHRLAPGLTSGEHGVRLGRPRGPELGPAQPVGDAVRQQARQTTQQRFHPRSYGGAREQ